MDVVGVSTEGWEAAVVVAGVAPREGNAGLAAESPLAGGILKREDVCALCAPPVAGVAAAPKRGLGVLAAAVVGVVDSAGLSLLALPNRPPLGGAAGVAPNSGFAAVEGVPDPKRPPDDWGCEVAGVVEEAAVEGVFEAGAAFMPPNKLGVLDPGGGPAGVVEVLPNKEPPAGAGVEAVLPNKLPPVFPAPKSPLVAD